jgi:AcrR family transcriptional regulator
MLLYVAIIATVNSVPGRFPAGGDAVPTPARTSLDAIVAAGRTIIEADGLEGLTMQAVADAVGVRAPSLYKRVRDRAALVRLIAEDAARELTALLDAAAHGDDPRRDLIAIATAFRSYARANAGAWSLLIARLPEDWRPDPALNARAVEPLLRAAGQLAGSDDALPAARTIVAWANGFVGMELAGAFRLGGDVDAAFTYGIEHLADALDGRRRPRQAR